MVSPASAANLRQQLEAAMVDERGFAIAGARQNVDRLWPVVEAAVSAARAETAEQIAQAIEAQVNGQQSIWSSKAYLNAAALARSVPGTTEGTP
jgi:hypothetical protein